MEGVMVLNACEWNNRGGGFDLCGADITQTYQTNFALLPRFRDGANGIGERGFAIW
jgi:hypothetical protein